MSADAMRRGLEVIKSLLEPDPPDPELTDLDDYTTAAKYLMRRLLLAGDGKGLRAVKTLMDRAVPS